MTPAVIDAVLAALDAAPAAFPALPVVDALWRAEGAEAAAPVPREGLWRAQTPQGFRFADILAAHRAHTGEAADDVAVAHAAGLAVRIVPGDEGELQDHHRRRPRAGAAHRERHGHQDRQRLRRARLRPRRRA